MHNACYNDGTVKYNGSNQKLCFNAYNIKFLYRNFQYAFTGREHKKGLYACAFALFFINIINFIKNIDFKSEDIIERFNIYEQEADNENIRRQNEIMLSGVTSSLEMQIAADVSEFLGSESAVNITSVIAEEKAVIEKISVVHNTDKNEDMIKEFLYNKYHIAKEKIEVVKGE